MLIVKSILREKKNWITGISIAIVIGLILGLNQGTNSYSSIKIDEISSQIDADVRVGIRTENYINDYAELRNFLGSRNEFTYMDSLLIKSDEYWSFENSTTSFNISDCYIFATDVERYLTHARTKDDLTFIEKDFSSSINNTEIIISKKLATDFSLELGNSIDIIFNNTESERFNNITNIKIVGIAQKSPSFKSSEIYEGSSSHVLQIIRFGNIFPVNEHYFILGNLSLIQDFLLPVLEEQYKYYTALNIFFKKDLEFTRLNHFLRKMSNYNNDILDVLHQIDSSGNSDILAYSFNLEYFLTEAENNIRHYKFLTLLSLLPVFIFVILLVYNLRDSLIYSNLEYYELYFNRGLKQRNFIIIFMKESIILSILGIFISLLFSEITFRLVLMRFSRNNMLSSIIGFFQRLGDSVLSLIILFFIESMLIFLISILSFNKYRKKKKSVSSENKAKNVSSNITLLVIGVIYPITFYIVNKYNLIEYYAFISPIFNFLMQFAVYTSILFISKSVMSLFGTKVFSLVARVYSSIFKKQKETLRLVKSLYNYKNSTYVASIIFLLFFSTSYIVMGAIITENSNYWIDNIAYQKIGGDLIALRIITGKYNTTENESVYEFSQNKEFLTTEVIGLLVNEYEILERVSSDSLTIVGISPLEFSTILYPAMKNISVFQTMDTNVSYGLIDENDQEQYSINTGDKLIISNGSYMDSITIVGVVDFLPTISSTSQLDLVIHKNNSIITQELDLGDRYLAIQYMFRDNSTVMTTNEFQSELNANFSELDFMYRSRESFVHNLYNPCLTFGVVPSSIQFFNFESILIVFVSFIGIISLLRNHFDKESGNISLILVRGYPKKKIFQYNVVFQLLILLSALIFTPVAFFSSFFFLYYYNISYFQQPMLMRVNIWSIILIILLTAILFVTIASGTEMYFYNKISSKKNLHKYLKRE